MLKRREGKLGLGTAYVHGLKFVRAPLVFIMDADMSHHPRDLVRFVEARKATGAKVVTGSRYVGDGGGACLMSGRDGGSRGVLGKIQPQLHRPSLTQQKKL